MPPRPFYRHRAIIAIVSLTAFWLSTAFSVQPMRLSNWRGSELSATFNPMAGAAEFSAQPMRLSNWRGSELSATFNPMAGATATPQPSDSSAAANDRLLGQASVVEPGGEHALEADNQASVVEPSGEHALEAYNQASALQESAADGRVRFYRRDLPDGGALAYFVVQLDDQVRVALVNADGATPGTDETGDTIWADRQPHLATVEEIAHAPYAARPDMTLLGALAFGFHGDVRTSDEGTVVIDNQLYHLNSGRATLCIGGDGRARIGLFDEAQARQCTQAFGAGPVILWGGKIANPDVTGADAAFVPYNPLGENFVQLDWRRMVYTGTYPKTVIGVGPRAGGGSYLVMVVSYGVRGVTLAEQLRAMGCTDALGGDDDSSTQAVWRGAPVVQRPVSEVPNAVAVYARE
jgi:hypothetical protein